MRFKRSDKNYLTKWFFETDQTILYSVLVLMLVGVIMLISAGNYAAARIGEPPFYFFWKALPTFAIGLASLFFFSCLNKKWILRISIAAGAATLILVLATLISPTCIKGSCRFLTIAGFQIHPSELLKPFFIVMTAWFISFRHTKREWWIFATAIAFLFATILFRRDLGMTAIYFGVLWGILYFANINWKILAGMIGVLAGIFGTAVAMFPHVQARIFGDADPFQINKSLDSIRSGGLFGKGSSSFVKSDLPDSHTDFVFAAFVEDRGIVFGILLLGLYFYLMFHILRITRTIDDKLTRLVCGGVVSLFTLHLILNIGTTLSITPAKGTILPFISYGGSAFITMCAVIGILLGLIRSYKFPTPNKKETI